MKCPRRFRVKPERKVDGKTIWPHHWVPNPEMTCFWGPDNACNSVRRHGTHCFSSFVQPVWSVVVMEVHSFICQKGHAPLPVVIWMFMAGTTKMFKHHCCQMQRNHCSLPNNGHQSHKHLSHISTLHFHYHQSKAPIIFVSFLSFQSSECKESYSSNFGCPHLAIKVWDDGSSWASRSGRPQQKILPCHGFAGEFGNKLSHASLVSCCCALSGIFGELSNGHSAVQFWT